MANTWQRISSRYVHTNPYYRIRHDEVIRPDGKPGNYFILEAPPSVFIIPVMPDGRILLIKMFRYPTQMESWEIPAGSRNPDEEAIAAAVREFTEETGYAAGSWEHLGTFQTSNSKTDGLGDAFVCTNIVPADGHDQLEEGISQTRLVTQDELADMIADGEITDGSTLAPLMMWLANRLRPDRCE